eukprot:208149-Chlamydomonas_euryale.AAC.1
MYAGGGADLHVFAAGAAARAPGVAALCCGPVHPHAPCAPHRVQAVSGHPCHPQRSGNKKGRTGEHGVCLESLPVAGSGLQRWTDWHVMSLPTFSKHTSSVEPSPLPPTPHTECCKLLTSPPAHTPCNYCCYYSAGLSGCDSAQISAAK